MTHSVKSFFFLCVKFTKCEANFKFFRSEHSGFIIQWLSRGIDVGQKFTKFSKYVHFQKPQRLFEESHRNTSYCGETSAISDWQEQPFSFVVHPLYKMGTLRLTSMTRGTFEWLKFEHIAKTHLKYQSQWKGPKTKPKAGCNFEDKTKVDGWNWGRQRRLCKHERSWKYFCFN